MKNNLYIFGLLLAVAGNVQAATIPKIIKINVTPTSAPAGTMFKFTAELDNPLPKSYKVKIDTLGKGFATMTGKNTSYSLSRAIFTTGTLTYKVVVVDAKSTIKGGTKSEFYTVKSAAPENHAPTLDLINAETLATTNTAYTVTFNAKDVDANLNSITMNWGDSSEPETLAATDGKDLVFSHTYTTADSFGWNAFATDNGTPVLNSKSISKIVTVSAPVVEVIAPPAKTTGYTKIANDGSELPDSATLGTNSKDWACTKDNKTGLIWEVKTDDDGLRNKDWYYSWYKPEGDNGGFAGYQNGNGHPGWCKGSECDTYAFTNAVNAQGLCGAKDWRMPSIDELLGIVKSGVSNPSIDTTYFPNTRSSWFWSSSPSADYSSNAWIVGFYLGGSFSYGKNDYYYVRLVR